MEVERRMTRSVAAVMYKDKKKKSALLTRKELQEVLTEPLPDPYPIMKAYNEKYFDGLARGFTIRWTYHLRRSAIKTNYSLRVIVMSKPLLIGLKKKIMIEGLLHELIHVKMFCLYDPNYLGHGESFVNMMNMINEKSKLNVTITKEGSLAKLASLQTIWECNECKVLLKRVVKRHPGGDWFAKKHAKICDGEWHVVQ